MPLPNQPKAKDKDMISFCNKEPMDLNAVTMMGLSAKVGKSPIGYFGTGLKFAIATFLRTGHTIEIYINGKKNAFTTKTFEFRDESFTAIYLNKTKLSYTTTLGRNWEVWQAYRELASNAMDEKQNLITDGEVDPKDWGTCIKVDGPSIDNCYANHSQIFCQGRVLFTLEGIGEAREGASDQMFYRGVCIHKLNTPSLFTWNILQTVELTEDRTMKYPWMAAYYIGQAIASCRDSDVISKSIMAHERTLEQTATYDHVNSPSKEFLEVVRLHAGAAGVSGSARRLWEKEVPPKERFKEANLSSDDLKMIEDAYIICRKMDDDFCIDHAPPKFVEDLGVGVLGMATGGEIYIAKATITMGLNIVAGTIYEEWLHRSRGFADETRSLQNHLINQLVKNARRL